MLAFTIIRLKVPKPMHYKKWYHCLIWTTLVFLSLFVLLKFDLKISIVMSLFMSLILSSKGNIEDIFMWKGKNTNYADVEEFIKYNEYDTKLIEFENKLKDQQGIEYLIYKYRFKQKLSYSQIAEKLDIETPRIAEKIEKICFAIRIYCKI
jgi:predicted XRE-type DNA-binding protein